MMTFRNPKVVSLPGEWMVPLIIGKAGAKIKALRKGHGGVKVEIDDNLMAVVIEAKDGAAAAASAAEVQVLWLGSLLPRLLTTPSGSQWLPMTPNSSLRLKTHAVVGSLLLPLTSSDFHHASSLPNHTPKAWWLPANSDPYLFFIQFVFFPI